MTSIDVRKRTEKSKKKNQNIQDFLDYMRKIFISV